MESKKMFLFAFWIFCGVVYFSFILAAIDNKITLQQFHVLEITVLEKLSLTASEMYQAKSENWSKLDEEVLDFFSEDSIIHRTEDCNLYFQKFVLPLAAEFNISNQSTVLAFSHLVNKQIGIFEVFLSLMFNSKNSHCVFIDQKSDEKIFRAVNGIAKCYNEKYLQGCKNCGKLLVLNKTFPVFWGDTTTLEADLICLNILLQENQDWNFFLNTAGTELPIMSLKAIADKLTEVNDNVVQSFVIPKSNRKRLNENYALKRYSFKRFDFKFESTGQNRLPCPFNWTIMKGSRHVALKRSMAEFLVHDKKALKYYNWLNHMLSGDEHYVSTLVTIDIFENGTYFQNIEKDTLHDQCPRYVIWYGKDNCKGKSIRSVCNFGIGDLEKMNNSSCWIANKFNFDVSPSAVILQWLNVAKLYPYFQFRHNLTSSES